MDGLVVNNSTPSQRGRDKSNDWQMEMLMEKLRAKANQYKSFYESSKTLRMTMLEKRYPIDSVERIQLQKCLDTLQQNIKVTSHQAMIERLESVSRQLGLKFVTGPSGLDLFISSDMFYLEVVLELNGGVKDVKIHHEGRGEQQSCEELVACLIRRDFADFTAQLEGLASIYQLNAEKKVKCKAFTALTSLETDLATLASLQSFITDPLTMVHQSPVGYLEKRRGGHAMKLTYFVSPYDLLDPKTRTITKLPTQGPIDVGQSVSVCMESSTAHKLQTAPLVTINRDNNWPSYAPLSPTNSLTVAGCFVLTLNKPMPLCLSLVNSIQAVTQVECADMSSPHPLLSLITQHASDGKADSANSRGLFVNVGDQHHCYLMTESRGLDGVLVSSVPFTHPNHVPQIITYLRQQALFNAVIASCVRPNTKQDLESMIMLEVTPLSWQHLSISLEHPVEESMATVEIDLTSIDRVTCKVYTSTESGSTSSEYATTVFQRCLSIPVTMRSLIKQWNAQSQRVENLYNGLGGGSGSSGPGGGNQGGNDFDGGDVKIKLEPGLGLVSHPGGSFDDSPGGGFDSFSSGPMETSDLSLGQSSMPFPDLQGKNLLGLLDPGVGSGSSGISTERKKRKRKSNDVWKSPKDSSSNDSTSLGTPTSREPNELPTPTSTPGLEFSTFDLENSTTCDKASDLDIEEVIGGTTEIEDVEEILKGVKKQKKLKEDKKLASDILFDLENKNLVPPSVSITPITSSSMTNFNSILSGMGLERRPGIEIIPISSAAPAPTQSSITITPISSKNVSEERSKDRKSNKSKDDKSKNEKKRKRKREDSPMGPPEKVPMKSSDPLSKPVSVSIKPADSTSPRPSSPASGSLRKYSSSPTGSNQLVLVSKSSPSSSSKSSKQSPKHSPAYGTSSPKNSLTSSPKHGTSSPKHQSSSSSGKPSLSTLKSAVSSPSKEKSKSKDSKDKDRKGFSSSGHSSPKLKSSSVKLKQLDLTNVDVPQSLQTGGTTPPQSGDGGKSSAGQSRNRKSSLSAVIDKLKSAQTCGEGESSKEKKEKSSSSSGKSDVKTGSTPGSSSSGNSGKPGENKTGEYMVKPSSDGIKLTINKTRTKDLKLKSSSSSSSSGSGSPKTHTGLKPGVSSGPASKKTHLGQKSSSPGLKSSSSSTTSTSGTSSTTSGSTSSSVSSSKKSSSVSSLQKSSGKGGGSPKTSSDQRGRDKSRPKSSSEKSVFASSKSDAKKLSPLRDESDFKNQQTPLVVEGFMKQLDTKFQIPKLSARNANTEEKKDKTSGERSSDSPKDRHQTKSSSEDSSKSKSSSTSVPLSVSSPKLQNKLPIEGSDNPNISIIPVSTSEGDRSSTDDALSSLKMELPISTMSFLEQSSPDLTREDHLSKRPLSAGLPCTVQEAAEMLLDFSAPGKAEKLLMMRRNTTPPPPLPLPPPPAFPGSPSVSVHIVKSPAPSRDIPLVNPSPHSSSPCITDDELMDEAVVGMGK